MHFVQYLSLPRSIEDVCNCRVNQLHDLTTSGPLPFLIFFLVLFFFLGLSVNFGFLSLSAMLFNNVRVLYEKKNLFHCCCCCCMALLRVPWSFAFKGCSGVCSFYCMIGNFPSSVISSLCCLAACVFMMLLVRVDVLP